MVTRTHLNVTLYVHCLSWLKVENLEGPIQEINNSNTERPKKMYTLFNHQYLWNKL